MTTSSPCPRTGVRWGATLIACAISLVSGTAARGQAIETFELVERGAVWNYLDTGANLGASSIVAPGYNSSNWKHPDFNDATWLSGPGPLGFGDAGLGTTIRRDPPGGRYITSYFRHQFDVVDPTVFNAIELGIRRDDGAIVYINGKEVVRTNMNAGTIQYNTAAAATVGGGAETAYNATVFSAMDPVIAGVLVAGENTITVELHNRSTSSSDTNMDIYLLGLVQQPDFGVISPPIGTGFEDPYVPFGDSDHFRFQSGDGNLAWQIESDTAEVGDDIGFVSFFSFYDAVDTSSQLLLFSGEQFRVRSEVLDVRGVTDVQVSIDAKTYDPEGELDANDYLRFKVLYTTDGIQPNATEVVFLDVNGGGSSSGFVESPLVTQASLKEAFVPLNSTQLPANWNARTFDSSGWPISGPNGGAEGGIGYERGTGYDPYIGAGLDVESAMYNVNESIFLRAPFTVTDLGVIEDLLLKIQYDDSFVAYINGVEVARDSARTPASPTPPNWNAGATGSHNDQSALAFTPFEIDLSSFPGLLVVGENVLAIQGLNRGRTSSDFLINPILSALVDDPSPPASLNAMNTGPEGAYFNYTTDLGAIPDSAATVQVLIEVGSNDEFLEEIYVDNIAVVGTPTNPDTFPAWMGLTTDFTGEDLAEESDPDGGGFSNVLEYAFGGDASVSSQVNEAGESMQPQFSIDETGRAVAKMNIIANEQTASYPTDGYIGVQDLNYILEFTTDLGGTWLSDRGAAPSFQLTDEGEDSGDRTVCVTLTSIEPMDIAFGVPGTFPENFYIRVKVERTIPPSP